MNCRFLLPDSIDAGRQKSKFGFQIFFKAVNFSACVRALTLFDNKPMSYLSKKRKSVTGFPLPLERVFPFVEEVEGATEDSLLPSFSCVTQPFVLLSVSTR